MLFINRNMKLFALLFLWAALFSPDHANSNSVDLPAELVYQTGDLQDESGMTGQASGNVGDDVAAEDGETDESENDEKGELAQLRELISFGKVFNALIILIVTYLINKYLTIILDNLSEKVVNYRLFIKRLAPVSRILIWSFAIYIVIAGIIAPPFETIIAISASVGIAVGFASQDILKNIFGGIMIILDRPFQVGDKIAIADHYGEVISVGLRSCRVVTPDDSVVSIPNAEVMNRAVSNTNSGALDCQVVAEIYLPATVDVAKVKQIAYKAVYASSYTYLNKPVDIIVLNEVQNRFFAYKLRVKAYVVDIRYEFLFKSDLTEMIVSECNRLGMVPLFVPGGEVKPVQDDR
jgi:small-conductance mechanosensitive channel